MRLRIIHVLIFTLLFINVYAQTADNWQILFNGKDFSGWRELNGKHKWEIKDGVIVGTDVHGQPNGFLCTEKEYQDFILELDVSIDTLMNNSGVQFRTTSTPEYLNGRVHGYQMEVDPKPQKWSGSIYEEGGTRHWLYTTELNPASKKAFKNLEWNHYRIECFGNMIRTWVNGIAVSHLIDNKFPKGFIGLQLHANNPNDPPGGNQVRYKNIRIKTTNIKPSPLDDVFVVNKIANDLSLQEKAHGYNLLWDGKSTKGWSNAIKKEGSIDGWKISGQSLITQPSGQSGGSSNNIITTKQFAEFILKFDFKLAPGANSGIKYFVDASQKEIMSRALEYQIVDDSADGRGGNYVLGSLAGLKSPASPINKFFYQRKIGDWNQGMIKVMSDNHIEYWLNGFKIVDFQRGSPEFQQWVSQSEYKDLPNFAKAQKGHILLECARGEVEYRSIKIKEINSTLR